MPGSFYRNDNLLSFKEISYELKINWIASLLQVFKDKSVFRK